MPNARDVGIIQMPLQGVPPGESVHATSNHQPAPKDICSSPNVILLSHVLLDVHPVKVSPIHPNPTARPPLGPHQMVVSVDMALKVGNALISLDMAAPGDGAPEVRSIVDECNSAFALEITEGYVAPVRVGTFGTTRKSVVLPGSG